MVMLNEKRNYLKPEQISNGDTVKFTTEGEWVESRFTNPDGSKRNQFIIKVLLNDQEEYSLSLNATNRNLMCREYGRDTTKWIGKVTGVEVVKVSVGGIIRNSIMLIPLAEVSDVAGE